MFLDMCVCMYVSKNMYNFTTRYFNNTPPNLMIMVIPAGKATSKQRQRMSSNRRRKRVENANGIDVERSTLFRRMAIDVAPTSDHRRRFHVAFSTSFQRRITGENANGNRR